MGLNLDEKKVVVAEVSARMATAQTIVLAEYSGLPVTHLTRLRAQARFGCLPARPEKHLGAAGGRGRCVCQSGRTDDGAADLQYLG